MAKSGNISPMLRMSPAPHWRGSCRRRHVNFAIILGLVPAIIAAISVFGWPAVGRLALAAGAAVIVELLTQRAMLQPVRINDLSAIIQGLLLALLLPPTAPAWLLVIGVIVMIVIGKQLFGGVGAYPLNPPLMAYAVLLLSWGNRIHPIGEPGLLGTAWIPALWIGGIILMLTGHLRWQAPAGMFMGICLASMGLGALLPGIATPAEQLASGSAVLGICFLCTDTTTAPANWWARILFGISAGVLVVLLRLWGTWPEPVPFALILMNLATPLFDRIKPKVSARITSHA